MKVRAKVMGAAAMCTFLTNFVVASCFPTLLRAGAGFVFVMFACICVLASCFAAFVLRETAGLSLEEIETGSISATRPAPYSSGRGEESR
jgi:hypothetical protein